MKNQLRFSGLLVWLLVGGIFIFAAGCSQQDVMVSGNRIVSDSQAKKSGEKTFYGPASPMGKGVARAWVTVNADGEPTAVGVNISANAVNNTGDHHQMYTLKLPKQGDLTLYDHITLEWNPEGHEPPGIYDLPHFDLHFYMISEQDRMAIQGMAPFDSDGDFQYDTPTIPTQYVPSVDVPDQGPVPLYTLGPGVVPQMGAHWVDGTSPEFTNPPFTRTYILGSYQGEFIFHEPMFTLDYLMTRPNEEIDIPQPSAYQKSGYYPHKYAFSYSPAPKEYTIALTDLQYKTHQ